MSKYQPIGGEKHPSRYSGWDQYRDAIPVRTEDEERTARCRWDAAKIRTAPDSATSDNLAPPLLQIKETDGQFVIIVKSGDGHGYLHTDGEWRASCLGPGGMTGYFPSRETAASTLSTWVASFSRYETRYTRRKGSKIIKAGKGNYAGR